MESIGIATFLCENPNKTEYKKTGQNLETGTNPEESQRIKQVFFFFSNANSCLKHLMKELKKYILDIKNYVFHKFFSYSLLLLVS